MRSRWDSIMEDIFFSGISIINSRLSRNNLTIMSPFIQVWCLVCLRQHIRQSPREKSHVESIICSFMHSVCLGFQFNMHTWATVFQKHDHVSARTTCVKDACRLLNFGEITTHHISPAGSIHRDSPAARYLMERGVIWRRRKRKNSSMKRRWRMMFSLLVLSQAHQLELRLLMLSYFLKNSQTTPTKG